MTSHSRPQTVVGTLPEQITLLSPALLTEHAPLLALIDHWKTVLRLHTGWHYDMDFIWILSLLNELRLPRGSRILDAGAGNGLLQFLLAAHGYEVISADFSERDVPFTASRIFRITRQDDPTVLAQKHRYQTFISHKRHVPSFSRMISALRHPWATGEKLLDYAAKVLNPRLWREIAAAPGKHYGTITYLTADCRAMTNVPSCSVDCVVSVSAVEHIDPEDLPAVTAEFSRVLKPGGALFVTTSAAKDHNWYFKACEGWCLCEEALRTGFALPAAPSNFAEYDTLFERLRSSELIQKRVPRIYFRSAHNALPWGIYDPKFLPVGICKRAATP